MRHFAAILVVGDEEVFTGFLEHFPAGRYSMLFAVDASETVECLETKGRRSWSSWTWRRFRRSSRALCASRRAPESSVLSLSQAGVGPMIPRSRGLGRASRSGCRGRRGGGARNPRRASPMAAGVHPGSAEAGWLRRGGRDHRERVLHVRSDPAAAEDG
ncbi:MAG: hypothetical protein MZV63_09770 [Marinilabiliales bacterium]|nr:hypothetical protein [Marinilabiliales bacterium]